LTDDSDETRPALWVSIKKATLRWSVASVFILVMLWNISVSSRWLSHALEGEGPARETLREVRDTNLHIQMRFYQLLTYLGRPIGLSPDDIRLVYIDDQTHWTQLHGRVPTSRQFLATLIHNASQSPGQARAIGLDVELLAPRNFEDGDDETASQKEDQALLDEIEAAATKGVPVILASAFYTADAGKNVRLPNIYTEEQLQAVGNKLDCKHMRCPSFGYINIPSDKRQVPVNQKLRTEGDPAEKVQDSFALALAKVVRDPESVQKSLGLKEEEPSEETIFGTFLPETSYKPVSALSLFYSNPAELKACAGKILLIGGHWRELQGHGALIDTHLSPAGVMSGLGLHANYLASLLDRQFAHEPPLWFDIVMDIVLGLIIYTCFEVAEGWSAVLVLALTAFIPILLAYLFLVTANVYLDFLLPIELYLIHIVYEMIQEYRAQRSGHKEHGHSTAGPKTLEEV
jgi:CHASE2 domain-containing sensor protein